MKMRKDDLNRFKRHVGKGKKVVIKSQDGEEDTFIFKPLGAKYLPDFMYLASVMEYTPTQKSSVKKMQKELKLGKATQEDLDELFDEYDDTATQRLLKRENAEVIIHLVKSMVVQSYPELSQDDELLDGFVMSNLQDLQSALMDLNQHMSADKAAEEKVLKKVEQLKQQRRGNA